MLSIQHKTTKTSVTAMRPEYDKLSFSSPDVPHGTNSVIYKSAKFLVLEYGITLEVPLPQFKQEEIATMVAKKVTSISVQPLKDEEGKPISLYGLDMTKKVLEPSEEEINKEFEKTTYSPMGSVKKYSSKEQAKEALISEKKLDLAKSLVKKDIEECLVVPELSDAFIDQFELIEPTETPV